MRSNEPFGNRPMATEQQIQSLKRSILWNEVEPGDPYDIRKSMIARLPGDKKPFMGNKLELICLFQAAEIERLALNLEQYRARFYQIQKNSLDRHSYEIQIKQLAANLQNDELLRVQNQKLKKFSERLNQELEQTKAKLSTGTQLTTNYQQALIQIQNLSEENGRLNVQINGLKQTLAACSQENKELFTRIEMLSQQLREHRDDEKKMEEYQNRFYLIGEEIKRLNLVLKTKTDEIQSLNIQLQQSQNQNSANKEENEQLMRHQGKLNQEINRLKAQIEFINSKKETEQLQIYEEKVSNALREVERLNGILHLLQSQKDEAHLLLKQCEQKNIHLTNLINQKVQRLRDYEQKSSQYEGASSLLSKEVQRLNIVLKNKLDQINTLQVRLNRVSEQNQFYVRQVADMESQAREMKQLRSQLQQMQIQVSSQQVSRQKLSKTNNDLLRRINELSFQIQKYSAFDEKIVRLQSENRSLFNQNKAMQVRLKESQNYDFELKRAMNELSDLRNIMVQEDINKKNQQQRIVQLNKKSIQYERIIEQLSNQIKRLNNVLKAKLADITNYQSKIYIMNTQIQTLLQKNVNEAETRMRIEQYQNKIALISQEIERIQGSLDSRVMQNNQLQHQIEMLNRENNGLREQLNHHALQLGKLRHGQDARQNKLVEYRNQILRLNEVNRVRFDQMSLEINDLIARNNLLKKQLDENRRSQKEIGDLERLNNLLRLKVEESAKWEASNIQLVRKTEFLQGNLDRLSINYENTRIQNDLLTTQKNEVQQQLSQYKIKVERILSEVQRLHQLLENLQIQTKELKRQNYQLKRQLGQSGSALSWKEKNQKLLREIQRLNIIISEKEQEIKELRVILTQDYALDRRLKEQLSLIVVLCAEIETLRSRMNQKEKEVQIIRRQSLVALKD